MSHIKIGSSADFSMENLKIQNILKQCTSSPKGLLITTQNTIFLKTISHNERKNQNFPRQNNLKQFISNKPALQRILEGIF